jgi:hypothetical protein
MRKRKKGASGIVKTIPLSIALAALSTGVAFADTADAQLVQVQKNDGKFYQFDLSQISDSNYADQVKAALKEAFPAGKSILVQVSETEWVEFGQNASVDKTLADIKADPTNNLGNPDDNAITPYPEA